MGGVEEDSLFFSFFEVFSECWKFDSFVCFLSSSEVFSEGWEQFSSSGFVFGMGQIW